MDSPLSAAVPELVLYTSAGCHLCDGAVAAIEHVLDERRVAGRPVPGFRSVDIGTDALLETAYRELIPVVTLGDERLELFVSERQLARLLERVLDRATAA